MDTSDALLLLLAAFFAVRLLFLVATYDPKKTDEFDGDVSGWN